MKRTHFVLQCLDQALQREFAGGIQPEIADRHHPHEGTHCNNLASTLFSHDRQDRFEHTEHTENVRVKLCSCLFQAGFFERARLREAGIVHQQIDAPGAVQDRLDAHLYGCLRSDIQREQFHAGSLVVCRRATGAKHPVALGGKPGCGGLAEAGGGSGDQRDFWCGIHLYSPVKSNQPTVMPAEHLVTDARRRAYGWSHARARSWMTAASRSGCSEVVRWPPGNIRMSRPAAPSRVRAAAIWPGS